MGTSAARNHLRCCEQRGRLALACYMGGGRSADRWNILEVTVLAAITWMEMEMEMAEER